MDDSQRRRLYSCAKATAKHRGIPWEFDIDSWFGTWGASGKFDRRGPGADDFVMARLGDVGPYSPTNVEIITRRQNSIDANTNNPKTTLEAATRSLGHGRGWTRVGSRFQVVVSHRYVGLFPTEHQAEAAYVAACIERTKQLQGSAA